jgi:hypothetical protein
VCYQGRKVNCVKLKLLFVQNMGSVAKLALFKFLTCDDFVDKYRMLKYI